MDITQSNWRSENVTVDNRINAIDPIILTLAKEVPLSTLNQFESGSFLYLSKEDLAVAYIKSNLTGFYPSYGYFDLNDHAFYYTEWTHGPVSLHYNTGTIPSIPEPNIFIFVFIVLCAFLLKRKRHN